VLWPDRQHLVAKERGSGHRSVDAFGAGTQAFGINDASQIVGVTIVPEPSTWAMMLLGFAGLGFAFSRSRRKASFV
jgi:PEP-CTERM motif-containing protein